MLRYWHNSNALSNAFEVASSCLYGIFGHFVLRALTFIERKLLLTQIITTARTGLGVYFFFCQRVWFIIFILCCCRCFWRNFIRRFDWTFDNRLNPSLPSSKCTFSQPFKDKCISEVARIGAYNLSSELKIWKAKFFNCAIRYISGVAAGEVWRWSLLGMERLVGTVEGSNLSKESVWTESECLRRSNSPALVATK